MGAFFNFLMSLTWIFSAALVLVNIEKDLFKILIFCLGSFVGSYLGSYIEEKLALGSNMIIAITNKEKENLVYKIRELNFDVIELSGKDELDEKNIYLIPTTRRKKQKLIHFIKRFDKTASIIVDNAYSDTNL